VALESPSKVRGRLTPAEVRACIHTICQDNNYDPFRELIELATGTQEVEVNGKKLTIPLADVDQRITIAKEIAQYMAPKLKSIEVTGEVDNTWDIKITHFTESGKPVEVSARNITTQLVQAAMGEGPKALKEAISSEVEDET
jgi:hypothetical protein